MCTQTVKPHCLLNVFAVHEHARLTKRERGRMGANPSPPPPMGRDIWRIKASFLVEGIPWTQVLTVPQDQLRVGFMPGRAETMIWVIFLLSRLRCSALTLGLGFWWELLSG